MLKSTPGRTGVGGNISLRKCLTKSLEQHFSAGERNSVATEKLGPVSMMNETRHGLRAPLLTSGGGHWPQASCEDVAEKMLLMPPVELWGAVGSETEDPTAAHQPCEFWWALQRSGSPPASPQVSGVATPLPLASLCDCDHALWEHRRHEPRWEASPSVGQHR